MKIILQNNKILNFASVFLYLLIFFSLFTGNSTVANIELSAIAILFLGVFISITRFKYDYFRTETDFFLTLVMSVLLIYFFIKAFFVELDYGYNYLSWPIYSFFLMIFLYYLRDFIFSWKIIITFNLFCLIAIYLFGYEVNGRLSFIFGPNMLYRIVCFLGFLPALYLLNKSNYIFYAFLSLFLILLWTILIIKIGSRGGLLLFLVLLFTIFIALEFYKNPYFLFLIFLFAIWIMLLFIDIIPLLGRLIVIEGAFSSRFSFLNDFFQQVNLVTGSSYEIFKPFASSGFKYPHNVFIELIMYFGIIGIIVSLIMLAAFIISFQNIKYFFEGSFEPSISLILSAFYICSFIGAQFSGDLTDNFALIAVSPILIMSNRKQLSLLR